MKRLLLNGMLAVLAGAVITTIQIGPGVAPDSSPLQAVSLSTSWDANTVYARDKVACTLKKRKKTFDEERQNCRHIKKKDSSKSP
jgi:hypothetical protein